jgi:hypothetical protein
MGYTDQILTSLLFDLPTTLDDTTERKMNRFYELEKMKDRGLFEEEYEQLRQDLMIRVPPQSANYEQKREEQFTEAQMLREIGEKLRQVSPAGGKELLDRAENMRLHLEGGNSDDKG